MIEITIRVTSQTAARRLAAALRQVAADEEHANQARTYRGAARRLERLVRPHYMPRARRPRHPGVDEEAVRRVVLGQPPFPELTRDEARLACWVLTRQHASATEIADRIHVTKRTVHRWRADTPKAVNV
ncbi:hypothetical protein [Streptomyces sp. NPDC047028]|uniref:hypothetical protein n=1 Tax=Streptomyces sp. NPDC047028 TaxID=3155793 RepID=UPI0033D2FA02